MTDLVLVPTFSRPEYLTLCLEHLALADGGRDKRVWISHDRHVNDFPGVAKEVEITKTVIAKFQSAFAELRFTVRTPHPYIGNPCNFLELYKEAYAQQDVRYVYLVEDDVLVGADFFRWHEAVQLRGLLRNPYFCTVGWHCIRNAKVPKSMDPLGIIESTRDFSSIGVCWQRENLAALIAHATPKFYCDMRNYLAGAFPGNLIPAGQWTEQAGVITRLLHQTKNRWVAWPTLRRCSHVGVSGYHRPNGHRFGGDIDERVKQLRAAVACDRIQSMSKDFADDIEPVLPAMEWREDQLFVAQKFPYEEGVI